MSTPLIRMLLAGAAISFAAAPAIAQDAGPFAEKLEATYALSGYDVTLGKPLIASGSTLEFDGATISSPELAEVTGSAEPLQIDAVIRFTDVIQQVDGSYTVKSFSTSDVLIDAMEGSVLVSNIRGEDLFVPARADHKSILQQTGSISAGPISIKYGDKIVATIDSVSSKSTYDAQQGTAGVDMIHSDSSISGIRVDLSVIDEPEAAGAIAALGLQELTGGFHQAFDWSMSTGRLDMTENRLWIDKLGSFDLKIDMGGYTAEVMTKIDGLKPQDDNQQDALSALAAEQKIAMEIAGALTLNSASLRFENTGVIDMLLEMVAKESGTTRQDYAQRTSSLVPFLLQNILGNDRLTLLLSDAVANFLRDPRSFDIKLAPPAPIPFDRILANIETPDNLIDALGLSVAANQ